MVYLFLADGFEEVEAIAPADLLRRAGVSVETVSINPDRRSVTGARGVCVMADTSLDNLDLEAAEMLIFPGGGPGTDNLAKCERLMQILDLAIETNIRIAAICAAPAKILGARGYLKGVKATCYPGLENLMTDAIVSYDPVVTDGIFTTSRGMGTACEFGIELVSLLCGDVKAFELRKAVVMP